MVGIRDTIATRLLRPLLIADRRGVEPIVRRWSVDGDMWRRAAIPCRSAPAVCTDTVLPAIYTQDGLVIVEPVDHGGRRECPVRWTEYNDGVDSTGHLSRLAWFVVEPIEEAIGGPMTHRESAERSITLTAAGRAGGVMGPRKVGWDPPPVRESALRGLGHGPIECGVREPAQSGLRPRHRCVNPLCAGRGTGLIESGGVMGLSRS